MQLKPLIIFCLLFLFIKNIHAQEKLFNYAGILHADAKNVITRGTKLTLNHTILKTLFKNKADEVRIAIPIEDETIVLYLKKKQLFSKNFQVILSGTMETYSYTPGYYLQGNVEGETNSFAAISVFNDFTGGVISYKGNNYNLAVANNNTDYTGDEYIIYADENFVAPAPQCFTKDDDEIMVLNRNPHVTQFNGCPLDMYFETGYKIFQNVGTAQNVMNYFTILFNGEQALYGNESIRAQLRQVKVWTVPEPETAYTDMISTLGSFAGRMDISGFNGDIAQYVTFTDLGGGAAFRDELCASSFLRSSVCGNLTPAYSPYPNYSFSVEVMTHEAGHTIGSPHTHSCTWPGGPIDNCFPVDDGPCSPGPSPVNGGTIMSYCHLTSAGINFANGFGPLPGNLIRTKMSNAATTGCTCNCANLQLDIEKQDINCNHAAGSATAIITDGTGPFSYAWSNGANSSSVSGLPAGTYYVTVTGASAYCKVVKGFKILDSSVTISLNPVPASVTKCANQICGISSTISSLGGGVYTYQWYKNGVAVPGATASSILFTSPVTAALSYFVIATKGTCVLQSATSTVNFVDIHVPVITTDGSANICEGNSVLLSIPGSTFFTEWQLNGIPIPGATGSTYIASVPGSYRVRNFYPLNGSCSMTSEPVNVVFLPLPDASVNPASLAICSGQAATIIHSPLAGETYTWYRNNAPIPGASSNFLNVNTGGNYYLKVLGANGCYSSSLPTTVIVNPLPVAVLNPTDTVALCEGGTLSLNATPLNLAQYIWYHDNQQVGTGSNNILNVTQPGIYFVKIINTITGCTTSSPSTYITSYPPPGIIACNDTIIAKNQSYTLSLRELTPVPIDHYEWEPATGLNNPYLRNPVTTLTHDQEYLVKGFYPSGCFATDKVLIRVLQGPAFYVPSAFSPNDDTKNDFLKCTAVGISSFKYFDIFNRYGQKIFHSTNLLTGWDGKWNGQKLSVGTYVYIVEGVDFGGKSVIAKGTVTILF